MGKQDNLFIDQLRHGVARDKLNALTRYAEDQHLIASGASPRRACQPIRARVRKREMDDLRGWWASRVDSALFEQIVGRSAERERCRRIWSDLAQRDDLAIG